MHLTGTSNTGLDAGTYTVTLTNTQNNLGFVYSLVLSEPAGWSLNGTILLASSSTASDGGVVPNIVGGTAPFTYLWSNGTTADTLTGVPAGTYGLTLTDANGCTETYLFPIGVVSSQDEPSMVALKTYPNPVQAGGTIRVEAAGNTWAVITDATGRVVYHRPVIGQQVAIPDVPTGAYLLLLYGEFGDLKGRGRIAIVR